MSAFKTYQKSNHQRSDPTGDGEKKVDMLSPELQCLGSENGLKVLLKTYKIIGNIAIFNHIKTGECR